MNKPSGDCVPGAPALDRLPAWAQEAAFDAFVRRNVPVPAFLAAAALKGFPVVAAPNDELVSGLGSAAAPSVQPLGVPPVGSTVFDSGRSMGPGTWAGRVSGISYSDDEPGSLVKPGSHPEVPASKVVPGFFPKHAK